MIAGAGLTGPRRPDGTRPRTDAHPVDRAMPFGRCPVSHQWAIRTLSVSVPGTDSRIALMPDIPTIPTTPLAERPPSRASNASERMDQTTRLAREIMDAETEERQTKTARLRKARMEREAEEVKVKAKAKAKAARAAKKPKASRKVAAD